VPDQGKDRGQLLPHSGSKSALDKLAMTDGQNSHLSSRRAAQNVPFIYSEPHHKMGVDSKLQKNRNKNQAYQRMLKQSLRNSRTDSIGSILHK